MLKKLLKYEFRALLKLWCILSAILLAASVVCGGIFSFSAVIENGALLILSIFLMMGWMFALFGYAVVTTILIAVRFYRTLFSDEGYLTFTLPVKKTHILNSKIIFGVVFQVSSFVVMIISLLAFFSLMSNEYFGASDILNIFSTIFPQPIGFDTWSILFLLEMLIYYIIGSFLSTLLLYFCIILACTLTKKARIITAIGIYVGANSILSFFTSILSNITMRSSVLVFSDVEALQTPALCLVTLSSILLLSVLCLILYASQYYMIDKKLNLA